VGLGIALALLLAPATAAATPVNVRIESTNGPLVPLTTVTLPTSPVAPAGAPADETCPADSVTAALDAATHGGWNGEWTDADGWSIKSVGSLVAPATGWRWAVYVNNVYLNDSPCHRALSTADRVLIYPLCTTGTASCYGGGPMEISPALPSLAYLGGSTQLQAWEINTTFDSQGIGTSTRTRSVGATVTWPDGSVLTTAFPTDPIAGTAYITFATRGDNAVRLSKGNHVPDRGNVCVSDGADGFCGTTIPPQNPFDPLAFCKTTGSDGLCGSPDHVPPVGYISQPVNAHVYPAGGRPRFLKGTVDFDPSDIDQVRLRLMRQATVTRYRVKKQRVWVKLKAHGRTVRKRVLKKRRVAYKTKACLSWNVNTSAWKALKKCDPATAGQFKADGADVWSYEFLTALPPGSYTLDALARDGAGNVDSTPELGRNRVTFTVK
jgi:hypothetical protein